MIGWLVKSLRNKYAEYKDASRKSDDAEKDYERNPESSYAEAKFDIEYKRLYHTYMLLVNQICEITGCSPGDAAKIIHSDDFRKLMEGD